MSSCCAILLATSIAALPVGLLINTSKPSTATTTKSQKLFLIEFL